MNDPVAPPALNPIASIAGMIILTIPAFLGFDPLTPLVALACAVPLVSAFAKPDLTVWVRTVLPILFISATLGLTNLLFTSPDIDLGKTLVSFAFVRISEFSVYRAASVFARSIAIATIATLTSVAMNPLAFVRALMVNLRLDPRWGFSLYAGINLVPFLVDDLMTMKNTRTIRMRGRKTPLRDSLAIPVIVLAGAVRKAERVAISMTIRELESHAQRTFIVDSPWKARDTVYLVVCAAAALLTGFVSMLSGSFRFDLG